MNQDIFNRGLALIPDETLTAKEVALAVELTYAIKKKQRIQATQIALEAAGHWPHEIKSYAELTAQELTACWTCAEAHSSSTNLRARVRAILHQRESSRASKRGVGHTRRCDGSGLERPSQNLYAGEHVLPECGGEHPDDTGAKARSEAVSVGPIREGTDSIVPRWD